MIDGRGPATRGITQSGIFVATAGRLWSIGNKVGPIDTIGVVQTQLGSESMLEKMLSATHIRQTKTSGNGE